MDSLDFHFIGFFIGFFGFAVSHPFGVDLHWGIGADSWSYH